MSSYTEAQRKYYQKNKDTIYRKTKKYKTAYNKGYWQKYKEIVKARKNLRKLKELEESLYKQEDKS